MKIFHAVTILGLSSGNIFLDFLMSQNITTGQLSSQKTRLGLFVAVV